MVTLNACPKRSVSLKTWIYTFEYMLSRIRRGLSLRQLESALAYMTG